MSDTPTTLTAAIDFAPTITAGITLAGDIVKLTDDELAVLNSPANQQARINAQNQARKDQIAKDADSGLKPGADLTPIEEDLS